MYKFQTVYLVVLWSISRLSSYIRSGIWWRSGISLRDYRRMTLSVFVLEYWRKLDIIGERRVLDALTDGDVLLCWCKDECHRHILASWLRLHDVKVTEI